MQVGEVVGAYRVVSLLGTGGMGEVWLAEHALLGRCVAIKLLRPEVSQQAVMVERFFDEARAATQILDPGIVQVHDFGWHDGRAYIVMEHLVGEVLSTRLARNQIVPAPIALRLVQQIAMTMAVAHGRGIVHRDLKPDNLFVVADPAVPGGERVKILDFGIAKLLADETTTTRTSAGAILGTPTYMSPEQCRNAGRVDHRTDIYALGCVLFHLLTGRPPFVGETAGDMIAAHLLDDPPAPSTVLATLTPEIDGLVMRCLAKSLDHRFATMSEFARAVAAAAGGSTLEISTISPLIPHSQRASVTHVPQPNLVGFLTTLGTGAEERAVSRSRHRRPWLPLGIGGLVVAGVLSFLIGRRDNTLAPTPAMTSTVMSLDAGSAVPPLDAAITLPEPVLDAAPAIAPTIAPIPARARKPKPPPPSDEDLYETRGD